MARNRREEECVITAKEQAWYDARTAKQDAKEAEVRKKADAFAREATEGVQGPMLGYDQERARQAYYRAYGAGRV